MAANTAEDLVGLLDYVRGRVDGRLAGLGDAEYLWEPVSGCWSVRPDGDEVFRADLAWPQPDPAPFTTVAWRMWHIGSQCLSGFSGVFFEGAQWGEPDLAWPGGADEAVAELGRQWDRFRGHVAGLDAQRLASELGEIGGPYAKDTYLALVLHVIDELIHHSAEIGVVRDLYRATTAGQVAVRAADAEASAP